MPKKRTYTAADIERADDLYDDHSQRELAEIMDIPPGTVAGWARKGWISTDENHHTCYTQSEIDAVDALYDRFSLPQIADLKGIPLRTLSDWKQKGWIGTDRDVRKHSHATPKKNRDRAHRAHRLVKRHGYQQQEVAEKMGVSPSMVSTWLKMHRQNTYIQSELE